MGCGRGFPFQSRHECEAQVIGEDYIKRDKSKKQNTKKYTECEAQVIGENCAKAAIKKQRQVTNTNTKNYTECVAQVKKVKSKKQIDERQS